MERLERRNDRALPVRGDLALGVGVALVRHRPALGDCRLKREPLAVVRVQLRVAALKPAEVQLGLLVGRRPRFPVLVLGAGQLRIERAEQRLDTRPDIRADRM